jgi:hypothetical protein
MKQTFPVFVRMHKVQVVFGVSDDQVRIWANKGLLTILKRGRMAFVRTEDMIKVIEGDDMQAVG